MSAVAADGIELERRIAASPEIVFSYFTDPERYRLWQGQEAELDPRPGGIFRVVMSGTSRTVVRGEFLELDPPKRLVLSWGWEQADWLPPEIQVPPGSTTVEVELTPDGDGTILRLRHGRLPDDPARRFHAWGWGVTLDRLVAAAAGEDPGPDPLANV